MIKTFSISFSKHLDLILLKCWKYNILNWICQNTMNKINNFSNVYNPLMNLYCLWLKIRKKQLYKIWNKHLTNTYSVLKIVNSIFINCWKQYNLCGMRIKTMLGRIEMTSEINVYKLWVYNLLVKWDLVYTKHGL